MQNIWKASILWFRDFSTYNLPTPNIIDIWVSLYPDLSSSGGIKVKATEDAISKPATTKLTRISLKSLTFFDTDEQPGTAGTVEVGEKLLRLLLQFDEFESFDDKFESFDILWYFHTVKFVTFLQIKKSVAVPVIYWSK